MLRLKLEAAAPTIITLAGLGCGLAGVALAPSAVALALLVLSLLLDVLDGYVARRLGCP